MYYVIRRVVFWGVVAAVGLLASLIALAVVVFWLSYPFDDRRFTKEAWGKGNDIERGHMADSLCEHYLKKGMPEAEVIALIGEGEVIPHAQNHWPKKCFGDYCRSYGVGYWSEGGMDDAWLMIFFDGDKRLVTTRIDGY